jgi:predicted amidophosphoribosyltransferase
MRLKFGGHLGAAEAFAPFMLDALQRGPPPGLPEAITWVPLGRRRMRTRGFDQAHALARALGDQLDAHPIRTLERRVETAPQARRGGDERRLALAGAFTAVGTVPNRLLLVDDVLTSGSTVAECARTLVDAGAREVGVITVGRSLGGSLPGRCYNPAGLRPGSVVARERFSR